MSCGPTNLRREGVTGVQQATVTLPAGHCDSRASWVVTIVGGVGAYTVSRTLSGAVVASNVVAAAGTYSGEGVLIDGLTIRATAPAGGTVTIVAVAVD